MSPPVPSQDPNASPLPPSPRSTSHSSLPEYSPVKPENSAVEKKLTNAAYAKKGLAVRFWQVGIEMRPFFNKGSLWAYPVYAAGGASFGYWLQGVDDRQRAVLDERKRALLEKRARKAQRDAERQGA